MKRLTIVVVAYNSRDDLDRLLPSLAAQTPSIDHEVAVVDNASTDGTPEYLAARWPDVRVIAAAENTGFGRANNRAVAGTASELVLFLNPDTIVPPDGLARLVAELESRPDAAVVGPRLVDGRGRAELSFGRMMTPWSELRQKLLVRGHDRGVSPVSALVERMTRRPREVDWVSGACLLIRRSDLEAAGLFDERFFMYAEDVDLCAAVRRLGRRVYFTATPEIVHLRGRSAASALARTQAAYRRSQLAFYRKHHPAWAPVLSAYLKIRGRHPDTPG